MNQEHRDALQASMHDICQDLDAEGVLTYLLGKGIIQEGQADVIMAIMRKSTRNMKLIDFVKSAGPSAFKEFINALQTCKQGYLVEKILMHLSPSSIQQLVLSGVNTTENNSGRVTSGAATAAGASNFGVQFRDAHGGHVSTYISQGPMHFGVASGQQSVPVAHSMPGAAGGQPPNDHQVADPVEEFDASFELEKIITNFDELPKEKTYKIKKALTPVLIEEIDNYRTTLFTKIDMRDLVNVHMPTVLPDAAIKSIRSTIDNSNGSYELCESLKRSSILTLLTFLKGLEKTHQAHLFASYSTKPFCHELLSILEKAKK